MEITENNLYHADWRSLIRLANFLKIPFPFIAESDFRRNMLVRQVKKRIEEERAIHFQSKMNNILISIYDDD
jgi:hypothetical protein